MQGNIPPSYTPPPEPPYVHVQSIEDGLAAHLEAEQRAREIGYRVDYYPQQTTSQPK